MELQDNSAEIYQFTLVLAFSIALVFFIYIYWFSIALRKTTLEREKAKQQILENETQEHTIKHLEHLKKPQRASLIQTVQSKQTSFQPSSK